MSTRVPYLIEKEIWLKGILIIRVRQERRIIAIRITVCSANSGDGGVQFPYRPISIGRVQMLGHGKVICVLNCSTLGCCHIPKVQPEIFPDFCVHLMSYSIVICEGINKLAYYHCCQVIAPVVVGMSTGSFTRLHDNC